MEDPEVILAGLDATKVLRILLELVVHSDDGAKQQRKISADADADADAAADAAAAAGMSLSLLAQGFKNVSGVSASSAIKKIAKPPAPWAKNFNLKGFLLYFPQVLKIKNKIKIVIIIILIIFFYL